MLMNLNLVGLIRLVTCCCTPMTVVAKSCERAPVGSLALLSGRREKER